MKSGFKWAFGILIGLIFMYLSIRDWPLDILFSGGVHWQILTLYSKNWSINFGWVIAYFGTLISMHIFRTWRWKPLLAPITKVSFWKLNRYCAVGFMMVFLLPFRLGELVRPYLISSEKENNISMSTALASIFVERTMDGVMIAGLMTMVIIFSTWTGSSPVLARLRAGSFIALVVFAALIAFLAALYVFKERASNLVYKVLSYVNEHLALKVRDMSERFLHGLTMFRSPGHFAWFIFLSALYWMSNGFGLYILARGFHIQIPVVAAFAMMSTVVIGMMIPNSPANIGSFWFFLIMPLEAYGVSISEPNVVMYSLSVWLIQLIQLVLFGGYFIATGKVRIHGILKKQETDMNKNMETSTK